MNDALLETLRQQVAAGSSSLPDALAGTGAGSDPALALLSQLLARREQTLEHELEARERGELLETQRQLEEARLLEEARTHEERQRQELRRARLERLRLRLSELEDELDAAQARLGDLALALGACPTCWGEDAGCRLCRGRGRPGFLRPDPAAFRRWIVPALPSSGLPGSGLPGSGLPSRAAFSLADRSGSAAPAPDPALSEPSPGGYAGETRSPAPERTRP